MTRQNGKTADEARIRRRIDDWAKALRAKDVDALMAHYAPDIVIFDLAPPLEYRGADAIRESLEEWFVTFEGPIGYEIRDLSVATGDDVAVSHSLNRISGKRTDGEDTDVWVRGTVGFRKIAGEWLVTHEHASVPFYVEPPFKASLDFQP